MMIQSINIIHPPSFNSFKLKQSPSWPSDIGTRYDDPTTEDFTVEPLDLSSSALEVFTFWNQALDSLPSIFCIQSNDFR